MYHSASIACVDKKKKKKSPMWELQVKFHWGQYEDCSLGDSPSGSSEQLFQRGKGGRSGEGDGTPLWYSCLENPMDGGAWWATVHGVAKSWTRLRDFTFTFHFHALEKEMATHSTVLAWRIPGMGEPGGLPSMGSHRVEHDWSDLSSSSSSSDCLEGLQERTHWDFCWISFFILRYNWWIKLY